MTDQFTTAHTDLLGEDASFKVTHKPSGRTVICCDTGNGGDQSYELVEMTNLEHVYRDICFAPTHAEAERLAKLYLLDFPLNPGD